MAKKQWKPGNMLYPLPAVMVSCGEAGTDANIITIAWAGTVCTNPPMVSISVRPERHSYALIKRTGDFVINLVGRSLVRQMDFCGVRSGRDMDKFAECRLTEGRWEATAAPFIEESPVNIGARVTQVIEAGSHHIFLAEVTAVQVDDSLLDERDRLILERAGLVAYNHGRYHALGKELGTFGFSVAKKKRAVLHKEGKKHGRQKKKS
ncbi:MAG: flavin reductase family protein [Lachnospiraceae bacterium]|nr:flavin reductase family protein [Lachnospiraceae bacterium]MDY5742222.1 flavin reductase family protein [Lachnospiraceae bacterium]